MAYGTTSGNDYSYSTSINNQRGKPSNSLLKVIGGNQYTKDLVGGTLNTLPGYSTLGNNIANPAVNYQGNTNTGYVQGVNTSAPSGTTSTPSPTGNTTTDTTQNTQTYVDPYAKWGGEAGYNQAVTDYNASKTQTLGSITDRISNDATGFNQGILDYLANYKTAQGGIDRQSVQNELARQQGNAGVRDMVGQGIRSGGVMLNNKGAANSSASEALAQAYAQLGRQELGRVGGQYAQGQNDIQYSQGLLNDQAATEQVNLGTQKTKVVNDIVTAAQTAFGQLDQQAATASLPQRIAIEQEKERIRGEAMTKLQQYDSVLSSGVAANAPTSVDQNRIKANELAQQGQAPANAFNFTDQIPAEFQNTGPFPSELPIFTFNKRKATFA